MSNKQEEIYKIKHIYNTNTVLNDLFSFTNQSYREIFVISIDDEIDRDKLCWGIVNNEVRLNKPRVMAYTPDSTSYIEYALDDLKDGHAMISYKRNKMKITYPTKQVVETYTMNGLRSLASEAMKPATEVCKTKPFDTIIIGNADNLSNSMLYAFLLSATINESNIWFIGSNNTLNGTRAEKSMWQWVRNHPGAECLEIRS